MKQAEEAGAPSAARQPNAKAKAKGKAKTKALPLEDLPKHTMELLESIKEAK
jgi:hypothetical protein